MPLKQINSQDQEIQLIQGNIQTALTPLENIPMVGGNLLRGISLTSGQDNLVQHGLDHTPIAFILAGINVDSRVWSPTSSSLNGASANRTVINLRCSTSCTISLWVN